MKNGENKQGKDKSCFFVQDAIEHVKYAKESAQIIKRIIFEDFEKYDPFVLSDLCAAALEHHIERLDYVLETLDTECPVREAYQRKLKEMRSKEAA